MKWLKAETPALEAEKKTQERGHLVTQKCTSEGEDGNLHWSLVPGPLHPHSSPGRLLIITQGLPRPLDPRPPEFDRPRYVLFGNVLWNKKWHLMPSWPLSKPDTHTPLPWRRLWKYWKARGLSWEACWKGSGRIPRRDSWQLEAPVVQGLCTPPHPNQKGRVQIASNGLKTQHMQEIEGILNSASLP